MDMDMDMDIHMEILINFNFIIHQMLADSFSFVVFLAVIEKDFCFASGGPAEAP